MKNYVVAALVGFTFSMSAVVAHANEPKKEEKHEKKDDKHEKKDGHGH